MIKDPTGFTTYPHYKNTTFYFSTNTANSFRHNQHYVTARKEVLDFLGETLSSYADEANKYYFNIEIHSAFDNFLKEFTDTRILQSKKLRQKFIDRFKGKISKLVPEIINNQKYYTTPKENESDEDDFNFDELDAAPLLSNDDIFEGCSADDFNFDELDTTSNDDIPIFTDFATKEDKSTKSNDVDEFDFTEFDETEKEESLTNAPTFLLSGEGYTLYISLKHMTFKATGFDPDVVYALQNLATLVLINHKFLTAKNHPEWLYCSFEGDLGVIFDKLTTGFSFLDQKDIDDADSFIYSSLYLAVMNYRNRLGYFKYHKPFVFEHE